MWYDIIDTALAIISSGAFLTIIVGAFVLPFAPSSSAR